MKRRLMLLLPILFPLVTQAWEVDVGGELRVRHEVWENFGLRAGADDDFTLGRLLLHADLRHPEGFRLYLQAKAAGLSDRRLPGGKRTLDEDRFDLQEGYLGIPLARNPGQRHELLLGRQALSFGKQRLVSPLGWSNTLRTWDGARLQSQMADWTLDSFYAIFAPVQPEAFNDSEEERSLYGVYARHAPKDTSLRYELYALGTRDQVVSNELFTVGNRVEGKVEGVPGLGYEIEAAYQFGRDRGQDVDAWFVAGELSYRVAACPFGSVLLLGFDHSSGDADPGDGERGTFHPLYPLAHAYHGYADLLGRRNLSDFRQGWSFWPVEKVLQLQIAHHFFQRVENSDAVYQAGNAAWPGTAGGSAHALGRELDLTLKWILGSQADLTLGYSRFYAGDALSASVPDACDVHFGYASLSLRF